MQDQKRYTIELTADEIHAAFHIISKTRVGDVPLLHCRAAHTALRELRIAKDITEANGE